METSPVSERVRKIPVSGIRVIFEKAAQMKDVIRLEVGEPDFDTPRQVRDAAKRALDDGFTHYTSAAGTPALRAAVASKLASDNRVEVDPDSEVVITPGAGPAVYLALASLLDPGDEVLIPDPAWPHYEACATLSGGRAVGYRLREVDGFRPRVEEVGALVNERTKAIVLNSPSNPTGSLLTRSDIEALAALAIEKDLIVISDEIYEKIIYDGNTHCSIASLDGMKERTITINAVSKTYAMTGWRVGYAAGRSDIIAQMTKLNLYINGCANSIAQSAAVAALTGSQSEIGGMLSEYAARRGLMVRRLREMGDGVSCTTPSGAFYAFPAFRLDGLTSFQASMFLLEHAHVATVPGIAFGQEGEGHVRISFAASLEKIDEAMNRVAKAVQSRVVAST